MTRGRKRTPTVLKLIASTLKPGRVVPDEPVPEGELNAPPDWMTKAQRAIWSAYLVRAPQGLLKELDAETFTAYVVAVDLRRRALEQLEKAKSLLEETKNGNMIQSNYLSIVNRQSLILLKVASELGFTPTSRTRISLRPGKADKTNPFAKHAAKR